MVTSYTFKRKTFSILSLLLCTLLVQASNIKGHVADKQTGEPMTGATIQIIGTSFGTVADMDGNYTLSNIPNGVYTLLVKYIGYKDQERSEEHTSQRQSH